MAFVMATEPRRMPTAQGIFPFKDSIPSHPPLMYLSLF
jgi:hypothetical protein